MNKILSLLCFLYVFLIPFYDIPQTFRGGIAASGVLGFVILLLFLMLLKNKTKTLNLPKEIVFTYGAFIFIYISSMFLNVNNLESNAINHVVLYTYSFIVYTAVSYFIINHKGIEWFSKVLGYSVIVVFIIGLFEMAVYYIRGYDGYLNFLNHSINAGLFQGIPRMRSTFDEPSHLALYLICILPILWTYKRKFSFTIGAITLLLTFSSSTFSGIAFSIAIFMGIYFFNLAKTPIKFLGLLFISIPILFILRFTALSGLYDKIINISSIDPYRYNAWLNALIDIKENFILGTGPASYYFKYDRGLFNWYLQIIYESGIIGLFALLLCLIVILIKIIKLKNSTLLFCYLVFVFSMLSMNHYYIPGFWILIAFVYKEYFSKKEVDANRSTVKINKLNNQNFSKTSQKPHIVQ